MVLALLCALVMLASAATAPSISINVEKSVPRQVEETTAKSVSRDYNAAWQAMTQALDQSRKDLLAAGFVGTAQEKLATQVEQQQKSGLHEHIVDKGHTVDVVFYSPEGSAMELHDTVRLQIEVMDGSKVIHSEDATVHYVALLTAAENSWKVRMLEAVPAF
jgi:hypothetical protein